MAKYSKEFKAQALEELELGHSYRDVSKKLRVGQDTLSRWKKEAQEKNNIRSASQQQELEMDDLLSLPAKKSTPKPSRQLEANQKHSALMAENKFLRHEINRLKTIIKVSLDLYGD